MTWQPISTAPKDGQRILAAYKTGRIEIIFWSEYYRAFCNGKFDSMDIPFSYGKDYFSGWMPLPPPPEERKP